MKRIRFQVEHTKSPQNPATKLEDWTQNVEQYGGKFPPNVLSAVKCGTNDD